MTNTTWDTSTNRGMVLSNGNHTARDPGNSGIVDVEATTAIHPGDKAYFEVTVSGFAAGTATTIGVATRPFDRRTDNNDPGGPSGGPVGNTFTNPYPNSATSISTGWDGGVDLGGNFIYTPHRKVAEWTQGGTVDIAVDTVNHKFWYRSSSNNLWDNSRNDNPATGAGGFNMSLLAGDTLYPLVYGWNKPGGTVTLNGGSRSFAGPMPAGFTALDDLGGGSGKPPTGTVTVGSGPDTLALRVSEDAWKGDAQFTVSVDGKQIGGIQTATASHAAGQTQIFNVMGNFAAGNHTATVNFLNNAYGGSAATDRNLFVTGASIDTTVVSAATLTEYSSGPQSFSFVASAGSGSDLVTVDHPARLAAGVQTISGTESDPSQAVFLDWRTFGTPAINDGDWVRAAVDAHGAFSASVNVDHPGMASTMFYRVGSGPTVAAWSDTPS